LRCPEPSAAYTDRDNHAGIDPTPKMATAEPFKNARLDVMESTSYLF
jgi:hypothetical protein